MPAWNQQEAEAASALNALYIKINAWQQDAERYMQSTDFQAQIAWAHAGRVCTTPRFTGTARQRLGKITG